MSEYMNYYDILRKPVLTEKSTLAQELQNKYFFYVDINSNKHLVKKAIENIFGVKVKKVNIITIKGKVKNFRGIQGKRADVKKAIVTLEQGEKIDIGGVK